jgi:3-oxoacyl-[acyl-carrier-protein] synthase II
MMIKAYINGLGNISPQKTYNPENFLSEIVKHPGNRLNCIEPDYEKFIDARLLRRMSRIIRMSWTAAKICLTDSGIKIPDAIITGTGMGCIADTEKFLMSIYDNEERLLPPTPFIQSTHNTIGAQIALMLKCTNYNMTYSQRGVAFENAIMDALLLLNKSNYRNVLVGGFDEMTDNQVILYNRLNYYKSGISDNLSLLNHLNAGTIAGEGNAFFMMSSEKTGNSYAVLDDVNTFNYPPDEKFVFDRIKTFLRENNLIVPDIDLFITGFNSDNNLDGIYHEVMEHLFPDTPVGYFKHLCGEYHTASAFALWLASNILKVQQIPEVIRYNRTTKKSIKNILIYNHYQKTNHSLILLTSC